MESFSLCPCGAPATVESTLDHKAMGYQYDTDPLEIAPSIDFKGFSTWNYESTVDHKNMMMRMEPMFDISPEDKAAGGHDLGRK